MAGEFGLEMGAGEAGAGLVEGGAGFGLGTVGEVGFDKGAE